jgi:hypothetical protein
MSVDLNVKTRRVESKVGKRFVGRYVTRARPIFEASDTGMASGELCEEVERSLGVSAIKVPDRGVPAAIRVRILLIRG